MLRLAREGESVYNLDMPTKRRVNITLDTAVHDEMRKFLDVVGEDFSAFVEQMCVSFLGQMRPLIRRIGNTSLAEAGLTPSEARVMFLQMMGQLSVDTGVSMNTILQELDTIEAEQNNVAKLLNAPKEPIHTPKVKKTTKAKK